jgi:hypothetical protein
MEEQSADVDTLLVSVGAAGLSPELRRGLAVTSGWLASNLKLPQRSRWRSRPEDRSMHPLVGL